MRTTRFALILGTTVALICGALVAASQASSPSSGSVSAGTAPMTWTGPAETASTPGTTVGNFTMADSDLLCGAPGAYCDDFTLNVNADAAFWTAHPGGVRVTLEWDSPSNDFDLETFDSSGVDTGDSVSADGATESVLITSATGSYTIRAVYSNVTAAGYRARAEIEAAGVGTAPQFPPPPATSPGTPRYQNYVAPPGEAEDPSNEPSIGVNWKTGAVFYQTFSPKTYRIRFDDCSSPAKATWEDKSAPDEIISNDPILFTDHETGRCFESNLQAGTKQSLASFTDDDGETWTQSQGSGLNSGVDHQTIGGGPYAAGGSVLAGPSGAYPHAVYYCAQDIADANCARSDDGGQTFGPAVPIYSAAQCTGIHGHVKVAPDGTVYVPNHNCGGKAAVVVSTDNGMTWTVRPVPSSSNGDWDPSIGIASDGTVYMGYLDAQQHPHGVVSHDKGVTWVNDHDLGTALGVQNAVFPAAVAGDPDRGAVAFIATPSGGDYSGATAFKAVWHLLIASTFDGGGSWTTVDATPDDPVQRDTICNEGTACGTRTDRNLADFMDATIDQDGRVLVGWADGCTGTCVAGGANTDSAKGTIARQSGGKRMFKAKDPVEPAKPGALLVTANRSSTGVPVVAWSSPDDGGSAITSYRVYRSPPGGGSFALIGSTTANKFEDEDADPNVDYVYRVSAVNAVGESGFCGSGTTVTPGESPCTPPGVTLFADPTGDANFLLPSSDPFASQHDLQHAWIAEPYIGPGVNKLVFTIKVADLSSVPPNTTWPLYFSVAGTDRSYYVAMVSDAASAVTYEYGTESRGSTTGAFYGASTKVGTPDDASYSPDGAIRIIVDPAKFGGLAAGTTIEKFQSRVTFRTGSGGLTPDNGPDDVVGPGGAYTLVGNEFCRPNNPPLARLTATPSSGRAPLVVVLDGSKSTDPDNDAIVTYTFSFGDGTPDQSGSSPTARHVYQKPGDYRAVLRVRDARHRASVGGAVAEIEVKAAKKTAVKHKARRRHRRVGLLPKSL